jgi:putative Mn2+ efflux pump MntP
MDQAAVWLAGSILFALGCIVIIAGIIVVNNLLHKYWKPVQFFKWAEHPPMRFMSDEEAAKIAPTMDEKK